MSKGTVLVVDDDAAILDLVQAVLEDEGYHVRVSVDGAALRSAHAQPPDLILLDMMMPLMDGVEVTQRLRADPATAHIPLVAVSARHNLAALAALLHVDAVLPKPFDLDDLSALTAHGVAQGRQRQQGKHDPS